MCINNQCMHTHKYTDTHMNTCAKESCILACLYPCARSNTHTCVQIYHTHKRDCVCDWHARILCRACWQFMQRMHRAHLAKMCLLGWAISETRKNKHSILFGAESCRVYSTKFEWSVVRGQEWATTKIWAYRKRCSYCWHRQTPALGVIHRFSACARCKVTFDRRCLCTADHSLVVAVCRPESVLKGARAAESTVLRSGRIVLNATCRVKDWIFNLKGVLILCRTDSNCKRYDPRGGGTKYTASAVTVE